MHQFLHLVRSSFEDIVVRHFGDHYGFIVILVMMVYRYWSVWRNEGGFTLPIIEGLLESEAKALLVR